MLRILNKPKITFMLNGSVLNETVLNGSSSSLATRIKELRIEKGLTQEALATAIGISRSAICYLEKGISKSIDGNHLIKAAKILGVSPEWLQFGIPHVRNVIPNTQVPLYSLSTLKTIYKIHVNSKNTTASYITTNCEVSHKAYALTVEGLSMVSVSGESTSFREGLIIVIDPLRKHKHGDYVIASVDPNDMPLLRQFIKEGDSQYMRPLNPQFPMIKTTSTTRYYGVVCQLIETLR